MRVIVAVVVKLALGCSLLMFTWPQRARFVTYLLMKNLGNDIGIIKATTTSRFSCHHRGKVYSHKTSTQGR